MAGKTGKEPVAERMVDNEEAAVTPWAEVRDRFSEASTHWLATMHPDGRPHVVPLGPLLIDDLVYFTMGQGTRKGKNLEANAQCTIVYSVKGWDVAIDGSAVKVADEAKLRRIAEAYAAQGWPAYVHDGVLDAPYSAPTTGPAPYDVYEMTPTTAFAFGNGEETAYNTTRYRF